MQTEFALFDWLVAGLGALVAWLARMMHSRQNNLEQRLNQVTADTQQIVGRETAELRRVIDRNHTQIINMLLRQRDSDESQ